MGQSTVTQKEIGFGGMVLVRILSGVFGVNNHSSSILGVSPPLEGITGILSYQATSILYHRPLSADAARIWTNSSLHLSALIPPSDCRNKSSYLSIETFPPPRTEPCLFSEVDRTGWSHRTKWGMMVPGKHSSEKNATGLSLPKGIDCFFRVVLGLTSGFPGHCGRSGHGREIRACSSQHPARVLLISCLHNKRDREFKEKVIIYWNWCPGVAVPQWFNLRPRFFLLSKSFSVSASLSFPLVWITH